jgi:hypothetical protein
LFGWASLGAVASGCYVMLAAHTGSAFWLRNVMAWLAGALLAFALSRVRFSPALAIGAIAVCVGALACTFLDADQMGVHRWINAGPLHMNVAALVLPLLLVALAAAPPGLAFRSGVAIVIVVIALLYWQPDASQASAFAVAALCLIGFESARSVIGRIAIATLVAIASATWLRPDPLPALPEVEGIIGLAWRISPLVTLSALVCLFVTVASPLILVPSGRAARVAIAMSSYFAISAVAPSCGNFPVPLVGAGMSSILGFWVGIGSLGAFHRYLIMSRREVAVAEPRGDSGRNQADARLIALASR